MANPLVVEVKIKNETIALVYDRWGAFDNYSVITRAAKYAKVVKDAADVEAAIKSMTYVSRCEIDAYVEICEPKFEMIRELADVLVEIDVTNNEVIVYDLVEIKANSIDNFVEYAERWESD